MRLTCFLAALFSLLCALVVSERGHHRHRHRSPDSHCRNCPPGSGVTSPCTKTHQTICSPCPPGFYSRHNSYKLPCWPCSLCGDGLFTSHKCNSLRDTVCDSCQTHYKPISNEDFRLKCQNSSRYSRSNRIPFDNVAKRDSSSFGFGFQNFIVIFTTCVIIVCTSVTVYYVIKNFKTTKTKYKELHEPETM